MPKHKQHITTTINSNTTLTTNYNVVNVSATASNITITLPALSTLDYDDFTIRKIDSSTNTVTIDANESETINGDTTLILTNQYDAAHLVAGEEWGTI
jgi:hypothetical protein